jgi:hypothetical protein
MQRVCKAKRTAAQCALEKCGLRDLEISPFPPKAPVAEGDTLLAVRRRTKDKRPQTVSIFVHLHHSGEISVYGEIGNLPGSYPCGILPNQWNYRMVHLPDQT